MKLRKITTIVLSMFLVTGLCRLDLHAQQSVNATGGEASGSGGTSSSTVGQIANQTLWAKNAYLSEGVQQPYEISIVTGMDEASDISLMLKAYPNPASKYLVLDVGDCQNRLLSYNLYDLSGQCVHQAGISKVQSTINMAQLPAGAYLLKVIDRNKELKTFKIIKN